MAPDAAAREPRARPKCPRILAFERRNPRGSANRRRRSTDRRSEQDGCPSASRSRTMRSSCRTRPSSSCLVAVAVARAAPRRRAFAHRATRTFSPRGPRSIAATGRASTRWRRSSRTMSSQPYVEYWQLKLEARHRRPTTRSRLSRPLAEDAARRPAARRLAEVAGQARRVGDVRRSTIRRRPARTPSSRATAIQYRRQRDGDAALAAAKPLWFTGQTHARCVRAAVRRADREAASCRVDDRRARFRLATEAGNVRLAQSIADDLPPDDRITAREFAHVDANPAARSRKGEFRVEAARRTRSRALRARARARAPTPRRSRGVGEAARPVCPKPIASTATRGSPITRRGS